MPNFTPIGATCLSPLRGEKPQNRPLCKLNTSSLRVKTQRFGRSYCTFQSNLSKNFNFGVLHPCRCTDGGETWHERGNLRSPPPCQISPHRCNDKGVRPQKLKLFSDLTKMCNKNAPRGVSLARFSQNLQCSVPSSVPNFTRHRCNVSPLGAKNLKIGL